MELLLKRSNGMFESQKKCPHCKESIKKGASVCKHCRSSTSNSSFFKSYFLEGALAPAIVGAFATIITALASSYFTYRSIKAIETSTTTQLEEVKNQTAEQLSNIMRVSKSNLDELEKLKPKFYNIYLTDYELASDAFGFTKCKVNSDGSFQNIASCQNGVFHLCKYLTAYGDGGVEAIEKYAYKSDGDRPNNSEINAGGFLVTNSDTILGIFCSEVIGQKQEQDLFDAIEALKPNKCSS